MSTRIAPNDTNTPRSKPPMIRQKTMHDYFRDAQPTTSHVTVTFQHTFGDRCSYAFDQGFANPMCQVLGLMFLICLFIGMGSALIGSNLDPYEIVGGRYRNETVYSAIVGESIWRTWTYIADPGTHSDVLPKPFERTVGALIGIGGIILSAMVIGLIVDGIKKKMDDLERGRGRVTERNHLLVLGWTEKTVQVINQLCLMLESEGGGTIVMVSDRVKKEAEAELRERCILINSRLVVRTGNMMAQSDLLKYSCHLARAIIVLAPDGAPDKADAQVLRTVLSIRGLRYDLQGHIVAEMRDIDNTSLVDLVGGSHVETIVSHDVVGRLMIQSARMRGLAEVFSSILGFEDDEIYVKSWPEFTGQTFNTVLRSFDTCVPIGISKPSNNPKGGPDIVSLNPPGTHVMTLNESIIVIAEDDDSYEPMLYGPKKLNTITKDGQSIKLPHWKEKKVVEKILMTGWRRDIDDVIVLLDELVCQGSELHMLSELSVDQRLSRLQDGGLDPSKDLHHLKLVHHVGNPAVRRQLKEIQLWQFDSVLILADEALEADMMHSDSNSLAILLLVRDLQLKDKGFHSRSNASERRMSEIMSSTLSAMGSPFGASRLAGVKSENNASMSSNMIVPSGSIGLNKMKSKFMSGAFKAKNIKKNALGGLNGLGKTSSNIGSKVTSKGTPPPPPFKQKGAQKNAKGKTINALDLLESSPPQLVSPFITSIVKTNQIINGTELEDSISIHNKRKLSGSTSNNGEIKHSKSTHNAKNGFLNKLSKRNAKKNMESKLDIIDRQKQASSFNTSNLQRKCLVTCELLDPQTHTIIMQNEVSYQTNKIEEKYTIQNKRRKNTDNSFFFSFFFFLFFFLFILNST